MLKDAESFTFPNPVLPLSQFRPDETDIEKTRSFQNIQRLTEALKFDPNLPEQDRESILNQFLDPNNLAAGAAGLAGGVTGKAISSFLNLTKNEQLLLSLAGFGIGTIMYKNMESDQSHLAKTDNAAGKTTIQFSPPRK